MASDDSFFFAPKLSAELGKGRELGSVGKRSSWAQASAAQSSGGRSGILFLRLVFVPFLSCPVLGPEWGMVMRKGMTRSEHVRSKDTQTNSAAAPEMVGWWRFFFFILEKG